MKIKSHIALIALSMLSVGCAITTGPANDGFELSQESIDNGKFFGEELLSLTIDPDELRKQYQQP